MSPALAPPRAHRRTGPRAQRRRDSRTTRLHWRVARQRSKSFVVKQFDPLLQIYLLANHPSSRSLYESQTVKSVSTRPSSTSSCVPRKCSTCSSSDAKNSLRPVARDSLLALARLRYSTASTLYIYSTCLCYIYARASSHGASSSMSPLPLGSSSATASAASSSASFFNCSVASAVRPRRQD